MKTFYTARIIGLLLLSNIFWRSYTQTENLRFEHLSKEQGLVGDNITCMLQDSRGFLWFGTSDGLNKYDGYSFTVYKHVRQDTTSLIQNSVFALWQDKDEIIWVGTAESGISKLDRHTGKFTHYKPEQDSTTFVPPFRAVSAINEDNYGTLWVGNWLGELRRFNKHTGNFLPEKYDLGYRPTFSGDTSRHNVIFSNSRDAINCIYKDRAGKLWVGNTTGLHELSIIPEKGPHAFKITFVHYRHDPNNSKSLSNNSVTSVFEDNAGMLWIGTDGGGLNRLDRKTGRFTHFVHDTKNPHSISSNAITRQTIAEILLGNLWVGTADGLNKLNPERTQFITYFQDSHDPTSISSNFVWSLLIDRSDILWTASLSQVNRSDLHQKPFALYRHDPFNDNSLSSDTITSIYVNKEGKIWIGTWGSGLNAMDKETGKFTHYRHDSRNPGSLRSDFVNYVAGTSDGNLLLWCENMLSIFNPKTGKFFHYPDFVRYPILSNNIAMCEDKDGLLWLGTDNGVISFDRTTGKTFHYLHDPNNPKGLCDHVCLSILEDKMGYIWVGHQSVGLSKLDKRTGIFTHYLPNVHDSTSLSSSIVQSIYEDSRGNLWFGTLGGGLCRFDYKKETFTTYTEKQGLADNTIFSIVEDADGNLWLGTPKGLSRFSPAAMTFTNYNSADGFSKSIFLYTGCKGKDGTLYFGGLDGLTAFDPRNLKPNRYIPPVVITQFKLFDKVIPGKDEAQEIILDHDENFFSFEFSSLNYTNSSKNQYAYQLVGVDKDWVYSGTRRFASYTDIGPGKYTFKVKASNNDGVWNENGISVRIVINPPWWRTNWAYAFYGVCFLAIVFAIDRYQRQRLIRIERERAKEKELAQAKEIEKAYQELKSTQSQLIQSEKMASLGELTAGIAHEIQNPLNFVNNFSDINTELIDELETEANRGNVDEVKLIAKDIKENSSKISHHGKRADSIVKGMLQHSRTSTGHKEPTDINKLADEYLRLAYHGMRAKDKDFNADIKTEFDEGIGNINVIPQDIGRVLLNLYNNAFYASSAKAFATADSNYKPTVTVTTKKLDHKVEVSVKDNGTGIPQKIVDKIFQPFFTTKPTGQGTGLGLSLSYDIIKAHGGEIKVETKVGEGSEFIIMLPS